MIIVLYVSVLLCLPQIALIASDEVVKVQLKGTYFKETDESTIFDVPRSVMDTFKGFSGMLEELSASSSDIPMPIDTTQLNVKTKEEAVNTIKTLMGYIPGHSDKKVGFPIWDAKTHDIHFSHALSMRSLNNLYNYIIFAQQYELRKDIIDSLIGAYITKLFNTDFTTLGTVQDQLQALSRNSDFDKSIARELIRFIFKNNQNIYHRTTISYAAGDKEQSADEDVIKKSKRLLQQFKLYKPIKKLGQNPLVSIIQSSYEILCYTKSPMSTVCMWPSKEDEHSLALSTDGNIMVALRKNGALESYIPPIAIGPFSSNQKLMSRKQLPHFQATEAAIAYSKQVETWCVGYNKSIVLFKIGFRFNINDLQRHEITTVADGAITYLTMLNNIIAITYKTISGEYEYHFFDTQKHTFLKDCGGCVEFVYHYQNTVIKKEMHLLSDGEKFINRAMILEMRKLLYVSLADEYNTILDDAQDNVYAISGIATNSIHLVCIPIIPSILKPCIHALNIVVEKNLQDKQQASLTLDMLYYIASKHPELAPKMRLSPELQEKVSFPMRTATNPTILNRIIHNFLFGNRLLQGAALLGVMGISGLLWYISRQKGITIFPTLRYFAKPVSSSATYRKIVPMYRR